MSKPDYLELAELWIEQGMDDDDHPVDQPVPAALLLVIAQELRMIRRILEPKEDPWAM